MAVATTSHASCLRLDTMTCAPCRASKRAVASPMPRLAPLTSAVLPVKSNNASIFASDCIAISRLWRYLATIDDERCRIGTGSATMQQRRVLITGAGSGLGRALAFCFAENGWRVACADINIDSANDTVRLLTEFGVGAMALWVDVADDASVEEMRDEGLAAWDGGDIVINNAGVASAGTIAETSL